MNKEAILRAADWLEANPDKHISGTMVDGDCFCAIGRIALEYGILPVVSDVFDLDVLSDKLGLSVDAIDLIWKTNDGAFPYSSCWVPSAARKAKTIALIRGIAA